MPDGVPGEVILVVDESLELIWLLFWRARGEGPDSAPGWWDDEYQCPAQLMADRASGRVHWCWVRQRESMIETGGSLLGGEAPALHTALVAGSPALAGGALPGVGFPMQPENLEARMLVRSFRTLEWVGEGPEPLTHRPWLEWIRENIFRLEPRWRPMLWPALSGGRTRMTVSGEPVGFRLLGDDDERDPPGDPTKGVGLATLVVRNVEPAICDCPLERIGRGLPHLEGCPRAKGQ